MFRSDSLHFYHFPISVSCIFESVGSMAQSQNTPSLPPLCCRASLRIELRPPPWRAALMEDRFKEKDILIEKVSWNGENETMVMRGICVSDMCMVAEAKCLFMLSWPLQVPTETAKLTALSLGNHVHRWIYATGCGTCGSRPLQRPVNMSRQSPELAECSHTSSDGDAPREWCRLLWLHVLAKLEQEGLLLLVSSGETLHLWFQIVQAWLRFNSILYCQVKWVDGKLRWGFTEQQQFTRRWRTNRWIRSFTSCQCSLSRERCDLWDGIWD